MCDIARPVNQPSFGLEFRKPMPRPIHRDQSHPLKGPGIYGAFQPRAARTMEMEHGSPGMIAPLREAETPTVLQTETLSSQISRHHLHPKPPGPGSAQTAPNPLCTLRMRSMWP